jgi:hypothetical protein
MARFERRPEYDLPLCHGCGDTAATDAWLDTLTGHLYWTDPALLERALEQTSERQIELPIETPLLTPQLVPYGPY